MVFVDHLPQTSVPGLGKTTFFFLKNHPITRAVRAFLISFCIFIYIKKGEIPKTLNNFAVFNNTNDFTIYRKKFYNIA